MVCTPHRRAGDYWEGTSSSFLFLRIKLNEGRSKIYAFIEANDSDCCQCGTEWLGHNGRGIDMARGGSGTMDEASKASCSHGKIRISRASSIQVLCLVGKINLEACMLQTKRRTQLFMNGNGRQALLKHLPFCTSRGRFLTHFLCFV